MNKTRLLISLLLFNFSIISSFCQEDVINKIIEIGKTDNQVMNHLDILTNRFGGRLVGSAAYENAVEWTAYKFKQWGLEVELHEAGSVPVGFNRGPWFGKLLGENAMDLHFVTPSYTAGTRGAQTGHVLIEPLSEEEFNKMKGALKGAWVLINGTSTGFPVDLSAKGESIRNKIKAENNEIAQKNREIMRSNRENRTNKPLLSFKEEPALFYREMCEAGVLGFIQSAPVPLRALRNNNVIYDPEMTFEKLPTIPEIKLDENQYRVIYQMAKERRNFFLEFDIRNHFKMGPVKYYSVIGKITGTEYPDEYVMVSGHLDAYDVATGGVDCGTGVTPAMEAARMIMEAGGKPRRSILFCLFAAEEFGLLGAKAWVKDNKDKLDKISNLSNRDGGPLPPVGVNVPQGMYNDFARICEPLRNLNPEIPFSVNLVPPRKKPQTAGSTDATVFAMEGVPTINFVEEDVKGYNFSYMEIWHTERDLYNKSIPEYMEHAATVTAIVSLGIANLDHLLSRDGLYIKE